MYKTGWHHHHHHGWGGHHRHGWGGGFFFLPLLLVGFVFFTMLKFLWPLLLIGILVALFSRGMRHGNHGPWGRGWGSDWGDKWKNEWDSEKRKNDFNGEKPKHDDDRCFTRTADGDWVEII